MRVSTAQFFAASSASMQNTQSNLLTLQQQIASGIALNSAGDNPSAFGQMAQLQQTQDANDQYQANRDTTDARLTSVSSALTNLVTTLRHGREKLHYLNPVPIHEIGERWIRKFERGRLQALSDLKRQLEKRDE